MPEAQTPLASQLVQLLNTLQAEPTTGLAWRKAMDRLLRLLPHLPGLARSNHPRYPEIWNDTLLRISQEIRQFELPETDVVASFVHWINLKLRLKYAVKDLQRGDRSRVTQRSPQAEFKRQVKQPPLSLDRPISRDADTTFADQLSAPSLESLEDQIAQLQQQENNQTVAEQLQTYIQQDPQTTLQSCHPRAHPRAHAQLLALRLLLKDPPDSLAQIARELAINYHTLNWHWQHKALPLLRAIALDWGYQPPQDP
ncbi:MAG: hypothetical protein AAGG51_09715 [Cyanobacteria bacterium P01_G01_bin.54]